MTFSFPSKCSKGLRALRTKKPSRLVYLALLTRVLLYGNIRVLYPLKNFLAQDWGVAEKDMNYILAAGELSSVGAGLVGSLGDRYGNRALAIAAWSMVFIFSCLVLCPPSLPLLFIARIISSLFATVFMVATQSAVVEQTDPNELGFATGVAETGWAFATLALVPILSVIYEYTEWRTMWGILCGLMLPIFVELWYKFPDDLRINRRDGNGEVSENKFVEHNESRDYNNASSLPCERQSGTTIRRSGLFQMNKLSWAYFRTTSIYACVFSIGPLMFNLSSLVLNIGHNLMFLAFTDWALKYYNVNAENMGAATFAIGAAELAGDMWVIFISDRIGLPATIKISSLFFALAIGMFILAARHSYAAGVALAAIIYLPGEAAFVAQIALAESFVPDHQRTTMLAMNYQCHFLGRAVGAFIADSIWSHGEVFSSGLLGVGTGVLTFLLQVLSERYIPANDVQESCSQMGRPLPDGSIPQLHKESDCKQVDEEKAYANTSVAIT